MEMLNDHSTLLAERVKAAGMDVTLQEWDEKILVWQNFGINVLPESKEAMDKIGVFIKKLFV